MIESFSDGLSLVSYAGWWRWGYSCGHWKSQKETMSLAIFYASLSCLVRGLSPVVITLKENTSLFLT